MWDLWLNSRIGRTPGSALGSEATAPSNQLFPAGHCQGITMSGGVQEAWYARSTPRAAPVPGEDFKQSQG